MKRKTGPLKICSFVLPPLKFNIIGEVRDDQTDELLIDAKVKSIGSDGITVETTTGDEGTFRFMLKPSTDYVFVASRVSYLNGKERETTKGLENSTDIKTIIYLSNIANTIELSNSNVFYDFARWDLRPEALVSLDQLVETLDDNPTVTIELMSHTDARGSDTTVTIELMSHTDARGSDTVNIELSQKRAQSVVDYLILKGVDPVRLTAKGYGETLPKVITMRIAEEYPFLRQGTRLTEPFIEGLPNLEQQEIAHQLNRRTEFRVLRTDYEPVDQ